MTNVIANQTIATECADTVAHATLTQYPWSDLLTLFLLVITHVPTTKQKVNKYRLKPHFSFAIFNIHKGLCHNCQ